MQSRFGNHIEILGKYRQPLREGKHPLRDLLESRMYKSLQKVPIRRKLNFFPTRRNPRRSVQRALPSLLKNFHDRYVYIDKVINKKTYKRYFDYLKLE